MAIKVLYKNGFSYNTSADQNGVVPAIEDVTQGQSQMANPSTDVIWDSELGAARFFMDFEEPTQTGTTIAGRTEHTSRYPPIMEAEEMWFSSSYLFPSSYVNDPEYEVVYQWHTGSIGGSPNFAIHVKNGRFVVYLWIGGGFLNQMAFDIGPVTRDVWHSFVAMLRMHPTDGELTVWKNGVLARCHNPVTGEEWIVPTSPPGGGITNDYTAYPDLGSIQQTQNGASLLVWNGKTARGTYPNPTKYPKWGFYKSIWGSRYNSDLSVKPEAYNPEDQLYVAPEYRQKTIYIKNVKFETRVEDFSHLEIYKSLDTDGESPLEVPEWWVWTEYDISVTVNGSGSVTGDGTYNEEQEVTLTATPSSGHQFDGWEVGGEIVETSNPWVFNATEDLAVIAKFSEIIPDTYTITVIQTSGGTVTGGGIYDDGDMATLEAMADQDYEFDGWSEGGSIVSTSNPWAFVVNGDRTITPVFSEVIPPPAEYNVVVTVTGSGSISGAGTYEDGQEVTLSATANSGWSFLHWSDVDGVYLDNPLIFIAEGNRDLNAIFVEDTPPVEEYTVTVIAGTGGSVSGGGVYEDGDLVTLEATPSAGWQFIGWSNGSTDNPYSFNITENVTLTAIFEEIPATTYTINVIQSSGGTVIGGGEFNEGDTVTLTASPLSTYTFKRWSDGTSVNPYVFNASENLTISAIFEKIPTPSKGYFKVKGIFKIKEE